MSDQPSHEQGAGSPPEPAVELTAEEETRVRRLIAEARHHEPVPSHVAARLERVLAELPPLSHTPGGVASSGESSGEFSGDAGHMVGAPVVDLAARRRRRNAAGLLAGAAAVIVTGFGIGQVIDVGQTSGDDDATSTAQPDRAQQSQETGEDSAAGGNAAGTGPASDEVPLELSSTDLEEDLTRELARRTDPPPESGVAPQPAPGYACPPAPANRYGFGELFPALFDGQPVVLALRPPSGTTQQADVLACGTADQLASVTITPR